MQDRGTRPPAKDWYDLVIQTIAIKNMTKAQLASRAGVSRATIDRWEKGASRPAQAASVNAVADVLGIDRQRALRLAGVITDTEPADRSPPARLREGTREAIRRDIDDPVLADQVIAYVEGLATGRIRPAREAREADPPGDGQGRQRGRA